MHCGFIKQSGEPSGGRERTNVQVRIVIYLKVFNTVNYSVIFSCVQRDNFLAFTYRFR